MSYTVILRTRYSYFDRLIIENYIILLLKEFKSNVIIIYKKLLLTIFVSPKRKLGRYMEVPPGLHGFCTGLLTGDPKVIGSI